MVIETLQVKINVKQRNHGTERRIEIIDEESGADFTKTQDWKLTAIGIRTEIRDLIDQLDYEESQEIGYIEVDSVSFDWQFTKTD